MKIRKMTATFGNLNHAVLCPGEGLTVITAPNEAGKSTWAGFWRVMLYGLDTRQRDKTGFLADKTRYAPWSGAPMSGEVEAEWMGKEILIRRFATRSAPLGGLEILSAVTGDPVPGLDGTNLGEQLIGAGREVYLRSGFVGQNAAAVTQNGELEAKLSALAASGQEDVSFSETERILKNWRNRRQSSRSSGLIPDLAGRIAQAEQSLQEMEEDRREIAEADRQILLLSQEQAGLRQDLEAWEELEKADRNRKYQQALREWTEAQALVSHPVSHPIFGTMSGEEAWTYAQEKQQETESILAENRRGQEEKAEKAREVSRRKNLALGGGIFTLLLLFLAILFFVTRRWAAGGLSAAGTAVFLVLSAVCFFLARKEESAIAEWSPVPVPENGDLLSQAADYREFLAKAQQAKAAAESARRRMEDLASQGGVLPDSLVLPSPPSRPKSDLLSRLETVTSELQQWQSRRDHAAGSLARMGDPDQLESEKAELEEQLETRKTELQALEIAMEALSAADSILREGFSPQLNQEAGSIFSELTGGRWPRISLPRDFSVSAAEQDSLIPRPVPALSAGTSDQLYLALRLAVCRLCLPDAPLLLDDALSAFDDRRMELALDYLKKLGQERQVLLFTCHSRESRWAAAHDVPCITF